ncbi:MAG: RelA/SpoT family protein, partial [Patescibacteria group bacterium]
TVEDQGATLREIRRKFGPDVAFLVNGVTKVDRLKYHGIERAAESMRKMFLATAEDIRIVIIKLLDRLHNMETLEYLPYPEKRLRIAKETLEIYAPLADRLGIWDIKARLEDSAFKYVYPDEYKWMVLELKNRIGPREKYLERVIPAVKKALGEENIRPIEVRARVKHNYSLWRKLLRYDMDWSRIFDLVAIRMIVENVSDAYGALGVIHKKWRPLPGRIKDYIAMPKPNGYQSLHTTVFCLNDQIVEFQIRTLEMHRESEMGIAAHWAWEEAGKPKHAEHLQGAKFAWVGQLREWQDSFRKNSRDSEDFLESLKIDFFKDRIFVLTPTGEVIDLPEGATPIDFAYRVHTDIGNRASGAKVNGKLVSLDHQLQSEDVVEILTQKNKKPSREWLEFVKTSIARSHIRQALRLGGIIPKAILKRKIVEMIVGVENRVGMLKDITTVLATLGINIENVESRAEGLSIPTITIKFLAKDKDVIGKAQLRVKKIKGVEAVTIKK